jgi:transketolase
LKDIDNLCINSIRFLAVDGVEKAKSGHPGLPLGASPMAYVIWDRFLRHNPKNPKWFNRDRFILSAGHGSMLLYSLLHLYGYNLPLSELKRFRQWGSKTPGHPEYGLTPGVEASTGPLGQGFSMGVGIAIAERFLGNCLNFTDHKIIDHYVYGIVSDGDLMEGVSSEAASLAGYLKLGKIIYLYDDNDISIEGDTGITFTEDVQKRFIAYGWQVQKVADGNDIQGIEKAIINAQKEEKKPSLIIVKTHIGYGSPKQDSASAHGEPLGNEALIATKEKLGWPLKPDFYIPKKALEHFKEKGERGDNWEKEWNQLVDSYGKIYPDLKEEFDNAVNNKLPPDLLEYLPIFNPEDDPIATRAASGKVMNALVPKIPHQLTGGSGDLAPSTKTLLIGYGDFGFHRACASNLHFGVREHAMGAIVNGMALHGGIIPYAATFLIFSDYMRPALRLAALMKIHSIFIFTHDSIGLGEDGPTHQPIEHLMSLRAIPGMTVIRPADANETSAAWGIAIQHKGPVCLALTRQKLPILDSKANQMMVGTRRGAYIFAQDKSGKPDLILIGTGSEVHLAIEAMYKLLEKGVNARVVSMPSWELFEKQTKNYKETVLPNNVPKLAIEAGSTLGWCKYVGLNGGVIGIDRFGASAPGKVALEKLGFNVDNVVLKALQLIKGEQK